jgi:hypothetical protein
MLFGRWNCFGRPDVPNRPPFTGREYFLAAVIDWQFSEMTSQLYQFSGLAKNSASPVSNYTRTVRSTCQAPSEGLSYFKSSSTKRAVSLIREHIHYS